MANYPKLIVKVSKFITPTILQQKLLDIIDNDEVRRGVNKIIADRTNKYVPMKSGALRESVKIGPKTISWGSGLNYARYQYGGEIYRTNYPIIQGGTLSGFFRKAGKRYPFFQGGTITGWYSIPNLQKVPSGAELGKPGEWRGWRFGYTTPGTHHHWIDEMLRTEKRSMNIQITNYLKREARKRNK